MVEVIELATQYAGCWCGGKRPSGTRVRKREHLHSTAGLNISRAPGVRQYILELIAGMLQPHISIL
jgi:hypothetical protein